MNVYNVVLGLNTWARKMVSDALKKEQYSSFCGLNNQEYPLYRYIFPDNKVYWEKVELIVYGYVFYGLKDKNGWVPESLW
jgi:hypothetical protein